MPASLPDSNSNPPVKTMSLDNHLQFYIGGDWVAPLATSTMDVIDPSTAQAFAVEIANDTPYGLAAYIQSGDLECARRLSRRLRVGNVHVNYPDWDTEAPFGGFKQSGNGREYAEFGLDDFLEIKGVIGYGA